MIANRIEPPVIRQSSVVRRAAQAHRAHRREGFTLIELLVVILIILIISAVTLPTIIPAVSHRQVSEAGRILQGALVGARDAAVHNNAPSGIRLLPDPTFNGIDPTTGQINANLPLASNRIIPIQPAPDYSEGLVTILYLPVTATTFNSNTTGLTYPIQGPGGTGGFYPIGNLDNGLSVTNGAVLMLEQQFSDPNTGLQNEPTSWFWNIRVGDQVQINNAGPWYTVVGPLYIAPTNPSFLGQNPELFVNVGTPGTASPLVRQVIPSNGSPSQIVNPEFLFLVNGQDDNGNGWVDEGFDGVDNNNNGIIDELLEWEVETWVGAQTNVAAAFQPILNVQYTIQRRPAPTSGAREVSLPTNVLVDLTTWNNAHPERSRLPVNTYTGNVDIMVYPNGSVVPTTIYSSPSKFAMGAAFYHFWLAERGDITSPVGTTVPTLPLGLVIPPTSSPAIPYVGPQLKGEYRLLTLFTRTGQLVTADNMLFDNPNQPIYNSTYNADLPFTAAQQGVRGGQ